ncbi:CSC1-like protein ERD4 [Amaranthus tricolor]|uniref:CSC1-like protein ERD4 n=1 Tax=Amaranthus tricolor TaxID=29722 RepID=UPI0025893097|nr:CSC1-like protein ERD4 [Amaranthus tricolor]
MDFSSFVTSVITSFLIFVVLMLIFAWLSRKPGNQVIYYPNRILKGLEIGSGSRNPISWIKEAISSKEDEIIAVSGVDTAVYFVYLSTALTMLVLAGIVLLPALLPIAATDHSVKLNSTNPNETTMAELDQFSMGHVGQNSPRLWAFLAAVYWVSLVTYYLLWKAYKHVSVIRATALKSPEVRSEQFAILVRDIPSLLEGETRKEQVDAYFKDIYPDTFYRSMVVTDNKEVNKIWEELEGYRKKLVRAEAVFAKSKTIGNTEGVRPTNRIGFLGLYGKKVDTIEYCNEKINELTPKLETVQQATLRDRQLSSALVFFSSRVTAASAAQSIHAPMIDTWTVEDAPEPRQLIWSNLSLNYYAREVRKYVVYVIVALTISFFMIPIGILSAFTTLQNLTKILPFIKPVVEIPAIRTVLEAYLPQLALIIFLAMLPKVLMLLSKVEGISSESHAVRAASGKYFYFIVLNVFIGVTLGGTLCGNFKDMKKNPGEIPNILGRGLPKNATFFLTFVALKFFVGYGLELSRLVPLIIFHLKKKYLCKTKSEVDAAWAPGDFGYATRFPGDMLILTITLCYSVIAPLIIPFGALYFGLGWLVMRNQALKVYVPSFESYGRMWPHMHKRFLAALVLYQITMLGYFGVKEFPYAALIIPLPIISLIFAFVCNKKFYGFFQHTALEVASCKLKETPNYERVYQSFFPPSLGSDKLDVEYGDV